MSANTILAETIAAIRTVLADELERVTIERAVVGVFFTGVKLSSGHVGACATPGQIVPDAACCAGALEVAPVPGQMRGARAADILAGVRHPNGIRRAVAIATMNALSAFAWDRRPHPDVDLEVGIDAFDAAPIRPDRTVVLVGAFVPFLRELKLRRQPYLVLEQDPATLKAEEMPFYRPAAQAPLVVPQADVLLITGSTLLNDTLDDILAAARPDTCTVVVGPTVGLVPDAYLRRGCDILGGIRVTRADEFLDILGEGGAGFHFFGQAAQKIVLRSRRRGGVCAQEDVAAARGRSGQPPT